MVIDCRGRRCPLPIIDLARVMSDVPIGATITVEADDPAAGPDIAAWCEMRVGFRNFRLDRVKTATLLDRFEDEPGRTLRDLLSQYGAEAVRLLD